MDRRCIREGLNLCGALLLCPVYIPHIISLAISGKSKRQLIRSDVIGMKRLVRVNLAFPFLLLYFLHNNSYYRSLFYFRIGPIMSLLIKWYRPGNKYFIFSQRMRIGKGFFLIHPYGTIINAESIGDNFKCIHLTTIGYNGNKRPTIGNDVTCGANVTIVGEVKIGNNVTIGAGSVVVKDIPDNCVVAGNPAKIIRFK